jgi:hypothetical protein
MEVMFSRILLILDNFPLTLSFGQPATNRKVAGLIPDEVIRLFN